MDLFLARVVLETVLLFREKVLSFFLQALEDRVADSSFEQTVQEVRETGRLIFQEVRASFAATLWFLEKVRSFILRGLLHRETCLEDFVADLSFNLPVLEFEHPVLLQDLAALLVLQTVRLVSAAGRREVHQGRSSTALRGS
ncbi:MAG TPA: hypothetical protein VF765_09845 [Polyangiaceae bacterium]